jgi:hemoglobin
MKRSACVVALFLVFMLAIPGMSQAQEKSLYERLGGYDAVAAVVDDFFGRMGADKQLQKYFVGFSDDSQRRTRQLTVDFICKATGGPCYYTGRDMATTHMGIGLTESDWTLAVKHLNGTLDKFKVPEKERGEVLAFISSLKDDIVE